MTEMTFMELLDAVWEYDLRFFLLSQPLRCDDKVIAWRVR